MRYNVTYVSRLRQREREIRRERGRKVEMEKRRREER